MRKLKIALAVLFWAVGQTSAGQNGEPATPRGPRCEIADLPQPHSFELRFFDRRGKLKKKMAFIDKNPLLDQLGPCTDYQVRGCEQVGYTAIIEMNGECIERSDPQSEGREVKNATEQLHFFSVSGNKVWSKRLRTSLSAYNVDVAENGSLVYLDPSVPELVFINSHGTEKRFSIKGHVYSNQITRNGRFAWVKGDDPENKTLGIHQWIFFDLEGGQAHEYVGEGFGEVTDDGLVRVTTGRVKQPDGTYSEDKLLYQYKFKQATP